jgi:hypothetical protein
VNGYAESAGSLRVGALQPWPDDISIRASDALVARDIETPLIAHLEALSLADAAQCSQLDVVIEIGLTRMQIIRFPAGVRKPLERTAFLKAAFRNVFGRDANDWHIIAEPTYVNEPVPAVAIDSRLMQALLALGDRHNLRVRSLRPSFMDTFNSLRRKLAAHTGAFALIENGRICLGLWRHRTWIALSAQAFVSADGDAVAALCAQMLARVDPPMPSGTLYIAGADKPFATNLHEGWNVQWLEPDTNAGSPKSASAKNNSAAVEARASSRPRVA